MAVKLYVGGLAVVAALVATLASMTVPAVHTPPPAAVVLMITLIAFTEYLQIRYYHHDEVDALNLVEGMLAPVIYTCSGTGVALITAAGLALGNILRRNDALKVVFNVSQWVLAASVGSLVLH